MTGLCHANPSISRAMGGIIILLASADAASAHLATEELARFGPFLAGLSHPVLGPDHFLAMFAVGLVSAILGGRHFWLVPLAFVATMPIGWLLGRLGTPFPPVEIGIALSVIVLGLAGFLAVRLPVPPVYFGIVIFALFHGYAHGAEMPGQFDPLPYALGFLAGTGGLHLLGLFVGDILHQPSGQNRPLRVLSASIAIAGCWFLIGHLLSPIMT